MPTGDVERRVDERLEELYRRHLPVDEGEVFGYYPPDLPEPERGRFGLSLAATDGQVYSVGDHDQPFAMQSISKVFVYGMALEDCGREYVLERVGVEPSGDPFYSITFDEWHNRPHNPMVNAGALVTTDLVGGADIAEQLERILGTLRRYAGNEGLRVNEEVFASEIRSADRNRMIAYLMRSLGMISDDVEEDLAGAGRPLCERRPQSDVHLRDVRRDRAVGIPDRHPRQEWGERRHPGRHPRKAGYRRLLAGARPAR